MTPGALRDCAAFAERLADKAAQIARAHFREGGAVANKARGGGFDPVTQADRAAEAAMREMIREAYPSHGIMGEEHGTHKGATGAPVWILDPIDGTRNYMSGALFWGTLVGLRHEGQMVLGLCDHPMTGERFVALSGAGEWRQGKARKVLRAREGVGLADALIGATTPEMFTTPHARAGWEAVREAARLAVYGGNGYFYGLLALGHLDAVIESSLSLFDVQPVIPIVEAAGGVITNWDGGVLDAGGQVVAAGSVGLHAEILEKLRGCRGTSPPA